MKALLAVILVFILANVGQVEAVVNGIVVQEGYYRYVALLRVRFSDFAVPTKMSCTGSYIGKNWILTAGHCITSSNPLYPRPVEVQVFMNSTTRLGGINGTATGYYPYYIPFNTNDVKNDIGLITVAFNPIFDVNNFPTPVLLPPYDPFNDYSPFDSYNYDGLNMAALGWGNFDMYNLTNPKNLLGNYFTVVGNTVCSARIHRPLIFDQFCLTSPVASSCRGDSGGPALLVPTPQVPYEYLMGVVSYGVMGSCSSTYPTVYTRITTKYLNWIYNTTGIINTRNPWGFKSAMYRNRI